MPLCVHEMVKGQRASLTHGWRAGEAHVVEKMRSCTKRGLGPQILLSGKIRTSVLTFPPTTLSYRIYSELFTLFFFPRGDRLMTAVLGVSLGTNVGTGIDIVISRWSCLLT